MKVPYVINIQKYSIHDGEGIRTTVFFKGCLLSCWWCHNPESQKYTQDLMYNSERCVGCMACSAACPQNAIQKDGTIACTDRSKCTLCQTCLDFCVNNAREIAGKQYTVEELLKEVEKDSMFYEESYGGVTLSGGEVMTQDMDFMETLLKKLKRKGYNIAIDTCGYAPYENYERVLPYVDTFLYDIKLMDTEKHEKYMGKGNELILSNLKKISDKGANINIRIPVIGGVNQDDEAIDAMISYLKENIRTQKVNLLPYHNTGASKYDKLQVNYHGEALSTPSDERMNEIKQKFETSGFMNVKVGG